MDTIERRRIRVTGTVQGVGFRPFVYRQAVTHGLCGFVRNDSNGVLIEVEGAPAAIDALCRVLVEAPPPLALVAAVDARPMAPSGGEGFTIIESREHGPPDAPVGVDTATCADCLREVDDPANRRYRYPFTNCTNCGPRYTIVRSVPYDRPTTTMATFTMCDTCQSEYDDPADRRFHAQPNACAACGPRLQWHTPDGVALASSDDALVAATDALRAGRVVALKGVGGYHLAVDATNADAVHELRRRKARDDKPFALMVRDVETARRLCVLDADAEAVLRSHRRPIVLAPRRPGGAVGDGVAPGLVELGVMLPYSALHHVLLEALDRPLVMTSGNVSDEPIAHTDDDAVARLGPMVDGILGHDRPIHIRCDDSVVRATARGVQVVRRSRGYAPEPLQMPWPASRQVVAVGAELKSTVAVAKGSVIVASHHIGDLEHLANHQAFRQAIGHLCDLYGVEPDAVAHDLHPEYLSTKFASDLDLPGVAIQHHHAHIASCLAEHGERGPVLGLAFDGLGYGCDGGLWGGEFLVADLTASERVAQLRDVPLPGGSSAIREPWRMALAWLLVARGPDAAAEYGRRTDERSSSVLHLARAPSCPSTSSMGRLFDAVAALLELRTRATYEAQAAIELEALAHLVPRDHALALPEPHVDASGDVPVLDPAALVAAVADAHGAGLPAAAIAAGFHESLGRGAVTLAVELAQRHALDTAALSGGVFQNSRLTEIVRDGLADAGLTVLTHARIPPNDGGVSVGQAAIAAFGNPPASYDGSSVPETGAKDTDRRPRRRGR